MCYRRNIVDQRLSSINEFYRVNVDHADMSERSSSLGLLVNTALLFIALVRFRMCSSVRAA